MSIQDDSTMVAVATPPAPPAPKAPPVADVATPTPTRKRRRRLPLVLGAVGVIVIALAAGAVLANASLSQTYGASRAVQDYYAAMAHRNADGMLANATFVRGDGSYSYFFAKPALQGMLALPANSDIHNVKVISDHPIDGSSRTVSVTMTWNGKESSETLTVRKDPSRVHWLFYPSWKVEIQATHIHIKLPNQAGFVSLDGILGPSENQTTVQAVPGYHRIDIAATTLYEGSRADVEATDASASVTLEGKIRASALDAAQVSVKNAFNNCDVAKYDDCLNHTYSAPDRNYIWSLKLPGYGNVDYATYVYTMVGDPTAGMKLTVESETGKLSVSGTCATLLTVDGSHRYNLKGDYTGTLTWTGGQFSSHIVGGCAEAKA
jgi:hypothetical protein